MMPFLSHRDREHIAMAILHMSGGDERMAAILREDKEKFYECYKEFYFKRLPRPQHAVQHNLSEGSEALFERLAAAERAEIIEGTAHPVDTSE